MKIILSLGLSLLAVQFCAAQNSAPAFKKGEVVSVSFYSIKNEASVLDTDKGRYKVHYEDINKPDEWVEADRVSKLDAGNTTGGPVPGKYICYMPMYEHMYMGTFVIPAKGKYKYLTGRKGSGAYQYNTATRKITWVSGDLAGKGVTGEYYNTQQNGPMIKLVFPKGKRVGDVQDCLCKELYK